MSKKPKKQDSGPPPIWADAKEVPVAGVGDPTAVARRAKWMRRFLIAGIFILPVALLVNLILVGQTLSNKNAPQAEAVSSSQGQAAATLALRTWLGADPPPLRGGQIVSWDGATSNTPPEKTTGPAGAGSKTFPTERDSFTVVDAYGQTYRSVVLVSLDPDGGAVAIGNPSLEPIPAARSKGVGQYAAWGSLTRIPPPDSVVSAVNAWVKALTSDDPDDLRLAVGDPDPDHSYLPLVGLYVESVSTPAGAVAPGTPARTVTPKQMIVRVDVTVSRTAPDPSSTQQTTLPTISYDVLVDGANTAAPNVVAWGGSGSGPDLTPYTNALPADVPVVTLSSLPEVSEEPGTTEATSSTPTSTPAPTTPTESTEPATTSPVVSTTERSTRTGAKTTPNPPKKHKAKDAPGTTHAKKGSKKKGKEKAAKTSAHQSKKHKAKKGGGH